MLKLSLSGFAFPLALAITAPVFGCGGGVASQAVSAGPTATRAPITPNAHGLVKIVGEALGDVPLADAQRVQIEKLAADAESRHAGARTARTDLMLAVAAQVQAGQIDRTALKPKLDALTAALQSAQPADRGSFEQLHALLSADQRTAFVDALEARAEERKGGLRAKRPMKQWAEDLKLTAAQKAQIKTALGQRFHGMAHEPSLRDAGHRGAKMLSAFKQDHFVMDEVAPARDVAQGVSKMSEHMLGVIEVALPILTADQRSIAAQKLRERAEFSEEMGPAL
jgi:Spy/CpxP family protein refolding chaperone